MGVQPCSVRRALLVSGASWLALSSAAAFAQAAPDSNAQVAAPADAPQAASVAAATPEGAQSSGVEEIVVTAQRRAENLQRTPIAITALTSQALRTSGITDLTGVIQATPSLNFAPYPLSSTTLVVYMRGQGIGDPGLITKDGGVGLYVDGIYQSRPQASTFDLADVERVEVLRGPQGTLYGRNTTGGAVNIISKKPTGEFDVHGLVGGGNFGYKRAIVNVDLPEFAGFKVKLTGLYNNQDGWAKNLHTDGVPDTHDWQSDRRYAFRGAVRWEPASNVTIDYSGDYSKDRTTPVRYVIRDPSLKYVLDNYPNARLAPFFANYNSNPDRSYRAAYLPYGHVESDGQTLIAEWRPVDSLALRSISGYRHINFNTYQDYTEAFFLPYDGVDTIHSKTYTQEFQAVGDLGDTIKYVFGLYYFHEKADHIQFTNNLGDLTQLGPDSAILSNRVTNAKSTSKAAYGQVTWTPPILDSRLGLTLGGRYTEDKRVADRVRTIQYFFGDTSPLIDPRFYGPGVYVPGGTVIGATDVSSKKFNPSFVASYRVNDQISTYAKVVTGYKAGGSNEASPTFTRTFNPEKVTSYEVGVKSDLFDRRVRLNLAAYYARYKDLQLDISANAQDVSQSDTFNVGKANIKGLEADLTVVPVDGLTLSASYAYSDYKIKDVLAPAGSIFDPAINPAATTKPGDDITGYFVLPFTPKNSYRLSGDWTVFKTATGSLAAHADFTWKGKVFTTAGDGPSVPKGRDFPVNDSYGLLDGRLTYTIQRNGGHNVSIGAFGKNILDKRYPGFVIGLGSITAGYTARPESYGTPRTYGIEIGFDL